MAGDRGTWGAHDEFQRTKFAREGPALKAHGLLLAVGGGRQRRSLWQRGLLQAPNFAQPGSGHRSEEGWENANDLQSLQTLPINSILILNHRS